MTYTVDNARYTRAEKFMMTAKARLFEDKTVMRHIMPSRDPVIKQCLAPGVRQF